MDFREVLYPIGQDDFLEQYWEKKPLLLQRDIGDYYSSLLSVDKLDEVITTSKVTYDDVRAVNANQSVNPESFLTKSGAIDTTKLFDRFFGGDSIVFRHLHRRIPELQNLCRELEKTFMAQEVQTNIYLSPPSSQSFQPHFDTHDVFILQVSGEKDWELFDSAVQYPFHAMGLNQVIANPGEPSQSFALKAGDLLYIPRGVVHKAKAGSQFSLQVTVGLIVYTWTDLLFSALRDVCTEYPEFRMSLPPPEHNSLKMPCHSEAVFENLLQKFADSATLSSALEALREDYFLSRRQLSRGRLSELIKFHSRAVDSLRYKSRKSNTVLIRTIGDQVRVDAPNRVIYFPVVAEKIVERALSGDAFGLSDLPGDLDEASRARIIGKLLTEALLEVVE